MFCDACGELAISSPGANKKVALPGFGKQHWIQFFAPKTNSSDILVGGENITAGRGIPVYPGGTFFLPGPVNLESVCLYFLGADDIMYWMRVGPYSG